MKDKLQNNRIHVSIFGETNSGKSSLFNALVDSEVSIVSEKNGTTTDPVLKSMELLPFGPIVLIDTAGINDKSELGKKREQKTIEILSKTDFAIYVISIDNHCENETSKMIEKFKSFKIPYMIAFSKKDIFEEQLKIYLEKYIGSIDFTIKTKIELDNFKSVLIKNLNKIIKKDVLMLDGLVEKGKTILLVIPIDEEAPVDRLILPQSKLIRECIDNGMAAVVTDDLNLKSTIDNLRKIDLVVTDSKVFNKVKNIIPLSIPLTSFSILMCREKGDLKVFVDSIDKIKDLQNDDTILICESCTHTKNHQDIGQKVIPSRLQSFTNKKLKFEFVSGNDFKTDLSKYALVIHCGGCMTTKKQIQNRIDICIDQNTPITNYGVLLAHMSGILKRSIEIF